MGLCFRAHQPVRAGRLVVSIPRGDGGSLLRRSRSVARSSTPCFNPPRGWWVFASGDPNGTGCSCDGSFQSPEGMVGLCFHYLAVVAMIKAASSNPPRGWWVFASLGRMKMSGYDAMCFNPPRGWWVFASDSVLLDATQVAAFQSPEGMVGLCFRPRSAVRTSPDITFQSPEGMVGLCFPYSSPGPRFLLR